MENKIRYISDVINIKIDFYFSSFLKKITCKFFFVFCRVGDACLPLLEDYLEIINVEYNK